jgi:hypothetical protein
MIPQKTRVAFQVRVRFAGAYPRKSSFLCGFALPYRSADPRFVKIEEYAPHFIGHLFPVSSEADLDQQVQRWLHESYEVGAQSFIGRSDAGNGSSSKPSKARRTR